MDMLLLHNLFNPSPLHDDSLCAAVEANMKTVVYGGQNSDAELNDRGNKRSLQEWGRSLMNELKGIADILDQVAGCSDFNDSLEKQKQKIEYPELTTSARMLADMQGLSFHELALILAQEHQSAFLSKPLESTYQDYFSDLAQASINAQRHEDSKTEPPFPLYLDEVQKDYEAVYHSLLNDQ